MQRLFPLKRLTESLLSSESKATSAISSQSQEGHIRQMYNESSRKREEINLLLTRLKNLQLYHAKQNAPKMIMECFMLIQNDKQFMHLKQIEQLNENKIIDNFISAHNRLMDPNLKFEKLLVNQDDATIQLTGREQALLNFTAAYFFVTKHLESVLKKAEEAFQYWSQLLGDQPLEIEQPRVLSNKLG